MGFRDEDDATRARADALQRELDDALRELGRLQVSEREATEEAEELRRRVAKLEKEQRKVKRPHPSGPERQRKQFFVFVSLAVAGGVLAAYFTMGGDDPGDELQRSRAEAERAAIEAIKARQERDRQRAMEPPPAPIEAEPAVPPVPAEPATPPRRLEVTWPAKIARVQGKSLRRGARCTVTARLESHGASDLDAAVDVACGDEVLYRWTDPLGSGMQMRDCQVGETPGPGGVFLHSLTCSDLGARTGRPQMSLDTDGHSAVVWSEAAPAFRVELTVSGDGRMPGPPLVAENELGGGSLVPLEATARVTAVTGSAPVRVGAACVLRVNPVSGGHNCRAELRCGTTALYGDRPSNGFNTCEIEDRAVRRIRDTSAGDGDPRFELDLEMDRIVVGDDDPAWQVTLALGRRSH